MMLAVTVMLSLIILVVRSVNWMVNGLGIPFRLRAVISSGWIVVTAEPLSTSA